MLGDGIFTQDGAAWKHSRKTLRPHFFKGQYEDLEIFREPTEKLLSCLPMAGHIVDLQPLFFRFTLDTTTHFLFGESAGSLLQAGSPSSDSFGDAFNTAQDYLARRSRIGRFYFLVGGSHFKTVCAQVHRFVDEVIERGSKSVSTASVSEKKRYLVLYKLLEEHSDKRALRDQLVNILLAGRDTTACLLSWTL